MSIAGWVTMVLICGIVWGGFAFLLTLALKAEARKSDAESASAE